MSSQIPVAERIALQDVMLRYAAGVDDRDYDLYQACFANNVEVLDFGEHPFTGKAAWLEFVWAALEQYSSTQHMLGPQLARIEGDMAFTRSDVQALHYFKDGDHQSFTLWATYFTDMRRIGHDWRIVKHRLVTRGTLLV